MKIDLYPEIECAKKVGIVTGKILIVTACLLPFVILLAVPQLLVGLLFFGAIAYGCYKTYRLITRKSRERDALEVMAYNCLNYWVRQSDGSLKAVGKPLTPHADNIIG